MKSTPFCSTDIKFINLNELNSNLLSLEYKDIVLVMSESSVIRWEFMPLIINLRNNCKKNKGSFTWIKSFNYNPTQVDICNALLQIGKNNIESIIAIGGGSSIDLAKGIAALYNKVNDNNINSGQIYTLIKQGAYNVNSFIDIIAVPSSAGTGSEVTQWATIWTDDKTEKLSIDTPTIKPKIAFIVPELTLTMSIYMSISCGLDAMCQAIEAYWAKKTNPIVQEIAYRAVELLVNNLWKIKHNPDDLITREILCRASIMAGLAFSQTRTTACHSISYPLTMLYGIPHGYAVALTLDSIARINRNHFENDVILFSLFDKYGGIKGYLNMVCDGVVNMKLSSFGIDIEDIPNIVCKSFTSGRMDNNPVYISEYELTKILYDIL
jgi:alcohol dehydrogenase class IV